jgi:hypothetical protein
MTIDNLSEFPSLRMQYQKEERPWETSQRKFLLSNVEVNFENKWSNLENQKGETNRESFLFGEEVKIFNLLFVPLLLTEFRYSTKLKNIFIPYPIYYFDASNILTVRGSYSIKPIFSGNLLKHFKIEKEEERELYIRILFRPYGGSTFFYPTLFEIEKKDIPPFDNSVILKFDQPLFDSEIDILELGVSYS